MISTMHAQRSWAQTSHQFLFNCGSDQSAVLVEELQLGFPSIVSGFLLFRFLKSSYLQIYWLLNLLGSFGVYPFSPRPPSPSTILSEESMERHWGFLKWCLKCGSQLMPTDGHSQCLFCLGEGCCCDTCPHCLKFFKRTWHNRASSLSKIGSLGICFGANQNVASQPNATNSALTEQSTPKSGTNPSV